MIHVVDNEQGFADLELVWRRMEMESDSSIFSSYDYIHTAWTSFKKPTDRLLILVSQTEHAPAIIAPFGIFWENRWGIPYREIRFIAEWEGDRPGILTTHSEEYAWREIVDFLCAKVGNWEALNLGEQLASLSGGNA
jgi:hypothetical protein